VDPEGTGAPLVLAARVQAWWAKRVQAEVLATTMPKLAKLAKGT